MLETISKHISVISSTFSFLLPVSKSGWRLEPCQHSFCGKNISPICIQTRSPRKKKNVTIKLDCGLMHSATSKRESKWRGQVQGHGGSPFHDAPMESYRYLRWILVVTHAKLPARFYLSRETNGKQHVILICSPAIHLEKQKTQQLQTPVQGLMDAT